MLVIFGPRGSFASSAWTRANPTAKTRKRDRKRFLNFMAVNGPVVPGMMRGKRRNEKERPACRRGDQRYEWGMACILKYIRVRYTNLI